MIKFYSTSRYFNKKEIEENTPMNKENKEYK